MSATYLFSVKFLITVFLLGNERQKSHLLFFEMDSFLNFSLQFPFSPPFLWGIVPSAQNTTPGAVIVIANTLPQSLASFIGNVPA